MQLKIAGLHKNSVVDGPGLRTVVFVQGCPHNCCGCHNPETHDQDGGSRVEINELAEQILAEKGLSGATFSGGEPFMQSKALSVLAAILKERGINLVVYSGYTFEQLTEMAKGDPAVAELLAAADLLIDGPYVQEERDLSVLYRGSRNQRIIDVPQSLQSGTVILSPLHFRGLKKENA